MTVNLEALVPEIIVLVIAAVVVVSIAKAVRVVPQASVFVIERLGRYTKTLQPGLHVLTPFLDKVRAKVDIREQVVAFQPQLTITRDNLSVGVDSVLYYSITEPNSATYAIENYVAAPLYC